MQFIRRTRNQLSSKKSEEKTDGFIVAGKLKTTGSVHWDDAFRNVRKSGVFRVNPGKLATVFPSPSKIA